MITSIAATIAEALGIIFVHRATEIVVTDRRALGRVLAHLAVFRSRRLRVSMSQLLSIEVGDKTLLLLNPLRKTLTPIGGVVRYYPSEANRLESEIGFEPEFNDGPQRYDLRGYLTGRNFVHFLRWYATGRGREQFALAREIEEEFLEIVIRRIVSYVRRVEFINVRSVHEGPTKEKGHGHWQYRFFEILALQEECNVSKRLADFIRSSAGKNSGLVLVSRNEMKRGRTDDGGILIGDSAGYLHSNSAAGPIKPPPLFVRR